METNRFEWTGRTWRMPVWLWLSLLAMIVSTLHILLDASVGLFPARGTLAPAVAAALLLISAIYGWWAISLVAGAQGVGGGIASAAVLGLGWTLLTNGYPIVYCPPLCPEGAPLTDIAHLGSIIFGIAAPAAAIWTLWRWRPRIGWVLPIVALVLVLATMAALSNAAIEPGQDAASITVALTWHE